MSPNLIKSIIRAVFPYLESSAAAAIAHFGFHVSPTSSAAIIALGGTFLATALHSLESKFAWIGVFLGWIGAPAYAPSAKKLLTQTVATLQAEIDALKGPAASPTVADLAPVVPAGPAVTTEGGTVTVTA